jgi:hypothetical protein
VEDSTRTRDVMLQAVTNGLFPIIGVKNMEVSLNKISDDVNMGKRKQIVANVGRNESGGAV